MQMPWRLTEVPNPFYGEHQRPWNDLPPGSYWTIPLIDLEEKEKTWLSVRPLSPEFYASGRDYVTWITLPGGAEWSPDFLSSESHQGWVTTGTLPTITVQPSVHQIGRYHGYIINGEVTDDLEGRTYD